MSILPKQQYTRPGSRREASESTKVRSYLTTWYSENNISNLTNPINPIFGFDRWENVISRKFLTPVLRLASLMLETPASQRLLYSLINPDTHYFLDHQDGKPRCHFRESAAADDVVQVGVRIALQQLEKSLTYRWYKKLPKGVGTKAYAATYFEWPDNAGEDCHIGVLSKTFRKTFITSTRRKKATNVNRWRFMLASTLCHEVAHALDGTLTEHCSRGLRRHVEHLYEDQTECEMGWAWEMEVLGAIRIGCNRVRDRDVFYALPSLDQRYEELDLEGEQHFCVVVPTVSIVDYMTRVQRQEFWDSSPRTGTMLRLSTRPEHSCTESPANGPGPKQRSIPNPGSAMIKANALLGPLFLTLGERAKFDHQLREWMEEITAGRSTPDKFEYFRMRLKALASRQQTAALIRRLNVRRLIRERQDDTPEPEVEDLRPEISEMPPMILRLGSSQLVFEGSK
ncbi:MAG: hypothetical protein Q9208_008290 [Pyrenodesmia sp. 3 TL-2023]